MKIVLCYFSLILLWIVIVLVFGVIYTLIGMSTLEFGWAYALGKSVANPPVWLIALGVVMLLRPFIYKAFWGERKMFGRFIPIALIILGCVWSFFSTGLDVVAKLARSDAFKTDVERCVELGEGQVLSGNLSETELKKIENTFVDFCIQMNKQLPLQIDEVTTLNAMVFTCWNMVATYTIDIDITDYSENDIDMMLDEMRERQKLQIPQMLKRGNYGFADKDLRSFLEFTGWRFRLSYFDRNNHMIGVNQFDYHDF